MVRARLRNGLILGDGTILTRLRMVSGTETTQAGGGIAFFPLGLSVFFLCLFIMFVCLILGSSTNLGNVVRKCSHPSRLQSGPPACTVPLPLLYLPSFQPGLIVSSAGKPKPNKPQNRPEAPTHGKASQPGQPFWPFSPGWAR